MTTMTQDTITIEPQLSANCTDYIVKKVCERSGCKSELIDPERNIHRITAGSALDLFVMALNFNHTVNEIISEEEYSGRIPDPNLN